MTKIKISPDKFFDNHTLKIAQQIKDVLIQLDGGLSIDWLIGFLQQVKDLDPVVIPAISLHIAIDVKYKWIYSIYHADNAVGSR